MAGAPPGPAPDGAPGCIGCIGVIMATGAVIGAATGTWRFDLFDMMLDGTSFQPRSVLWWAWVSVPTDICLNCSFPYRYPPLSSGGPPCCGGPCCGGGAAGCMGCIVGGPGCMGCMGCMGCTGGGACCIIDMGGSPRCIC